jgi:hypothetical protein
MKFCIKSLILDVFAYVELLIRMRLHIWYYIKLKPKPSFGIHVATNCICNKSVCYNFNEFGETSWMCFHCRYIESFHSLS